MGLASASSCVGSLVPRRRAGKTLAVAVVEFLPWCTRGRIEGGWTPCSLLGVGRSSIARNEAAADAIAAAPGLIAGMLRRMSSTACELAGQSRSERVRNLHCRVTDRFPSTVGIEHVPDLHDEIERVPQSRGRRAEAMASWRVGFRGTNVRPASIVLQFYQLCVLVDESVETTLKCARLKGHVLKAMCCVWRQ